MYIFDYFAVPTYTNAKISLRRLMDRLLDLMAFLFIVLISINRKFNVIEIHSDNVCCKF
jgi:hypothetical protein